MRYPAKSSKVRFLGNVAAVAVLAGTAAGCSADVTRFGNLFEPTSNQQAMVPGGSPDGVVTGSLPPPPPVATAYPTASVTSNTLPPAPGAVASNAPFVRSDTLSAATPAATASGWTTAGGTPYVIRPDETLQTISRRYGIPEPALRQSNNLSAAAVLVPGQQIIIPVYNYGASVAAAPTIAVPSVNTAPPVAAAGGIYVVKSGDSLGRIANGYGMRSAELAALNGIDPAAPIKVGQKLRLPSNATATTQVAALNTGTMSDATVRPAPAPAPSPVAATKPAAPAQPTAPATPPSQTAALSQGAKSAPQTATGTGVQAASNGNFRWPVRGRVISGYGVKANGERNDGINIEVPEGTPIKAAEGGEVIYAGNELKGYGNLVLVKHPSGMVSAYAHASEILVQRGDTVMRGQTLGKVGATGNVTRPQLHFEIRSGNRPVDPLPYLSG
jgi:murein DD-endopeptidase MepM/ murein hydrolase activator NlpD